MVTKVHAHEGFSFDFIDYSIENLCKTTAPVPGTVETLIKDYLWAE